MKNSTHNSLLEQQEARSGHKRNQKTQKLYHDTKFYVVTQSSVVEGNSVAIKNFVVATYYSSIQAAMYLRIVVTQETLVVT